MIIRREKHENKYTIIDNKTIQDDSLSWKARGLLCYLLSMPDDWKTYAEELTEHTTDGITATRTAIQELIDAGYITRNQQRSENGRYGDWEYIVRETKNIPNDEEPKSENLTSENLKLLSTHSTKYPLNKHIHIDAEKIFENPETLDDGGFDEYVNGNPEMNAYISVFEQEMGKRIMPYSKVLELANKFKSAGLTPEEYRQAIREQKANGYTITRMESTENYALNFKKPKRKNKIHKNSNPNLSNFGSYWNMQSREEKIAALKDMKAKGRLVPADEAEAIEVGLLEEE